MAAGEEGEAGAGWAEAEGTRCGSGGGDGRGGRKGGSGRGGGGDGRVGGGRVGGGASVAVAELAAGVEGEAGAASWAVAGAGGEEAAAGAAQERGQGRRGRSCGGKTREKIRAIHTTIIKNPTKRRHLPKKSTYSQLNQ